jgi:hypothetical protein
VLDTADANGVGVAESITRVLTAGNYFARVTGANNNVQLYGLDLSGTSTFTWQGDDDAWMAQNWHDGSVGGYTPSSGIDMVIDVGAAATLTVDGTLIVDTVVVDGTLSGSGTISTSDSIVINGILSPGGDGIGTLTFGSGEMALVSTHDAKVVVPEPGTLAMLLGGLAGLVVLGWRRRT